MLVFQWEKRAIRLFALQGERFSRALFRAVSKSGGDAIRKVRTEAGRRVRARKRFKLRRVRESTPVHFPRAARDLGDLEWRMDVSGAPVRMGEFSHRQLRKGVSASINVGKRSLVKGAFVATMKSGHTGIFKREGKARLPIEELLTTRMSDVFKDAGLVPDLHSRAQKAFAETFDRVLPLELEKANR